MSSEVRVIEASRSSQTGDVLVSLQLRYWRAIHAELMTHRVFSRNAGSSRAIPVKKMLAQVWGDPAGPLHWGANQAGMQAGAQLAGWRLYAAKKVWRAAAKAATFFSWLEMKIGLHKQVANRITEPYQYINVLVSSTRWDNFFDLRCHPDAQPEMQDLAVKMRSAVLGTTPITLQPGEWHLPYVLPRERATLSTRSLLALSTARCARISYEPFDGNSSFDKETERHDMLVGSEPIHASPTEHQAVVSHSGGAFANYDGFAQYRYYIELGGLPAWMK